MSAEVLISAVEHKHRFLLVAVHHFSAVGYAGEGQADGHSNSKCQALTHIGSNDILRPQSRTSSCTLRPVGEW